MKNIKRILALVLALSILLCGLTVNTIAADTVPDLPTATATAIEKDGLTYAINFKADSVSDAQLNYYGEWVNVPFEPVTLEANKPLKIMAYAAELLGESGLKYTYKEYVKLTHAQQEAYMKSFESIEAFFDWYEKAKEEYEKNNPPIDVGDGNIDLEGILGK